MPIMTGLSGNEIFCLQLKGLAPGELVLGNSVGSLGFLGGVGAGFRGILGGEITQVTEMISEGRHLAQARLVAEAKRFQAHGVTGVTSELRHMQGNIEFCRSAPACTFPSAGRRQIRLPPAATVRSCSAWWTPATCRGDLSSAM
jgi:uncharacterized protein YbjQ (UPF0145 family)